MEAAGRFLAIGGHIDLQLEIRATGALLIRGPDAFAADAPDMAFIRYPMGDDEVPFLPGSSLKGVLRSGAEALLRSLGRKACEKRDDRCLACLTFGSTLGAAAVLVEDGLPWVQGASGEERAQAREQLERTRTVRTSVAIDRQAGSVAHGPFDYEALVQASFFPTIRLRNPAPWQAALVAAALALLDEGYLRIGGMTSRGLGRVQVGCRALEIVTLRDSLKDLWDPAWPTAPAIPPLVRRQAPNPGATLQSWRDNLVDWLKEAER